MRRYRFVNLIVNGNKTASLDIYAENNMFTVFQYDECVFQGSYSETVNYINQWKAAKQELVNYINSTGQECHYDQNI